MSQGQQDQEREQREHESAREHTALSASTVYLAVCKEGTEELSRSTAALAWSGLAAGLSMGFSLVAEGLFRALLPEAPWRPLIAKLGYSVGFLIVILGRQQLFTENTLTPILPLLSHRSWEVFWNVLRLWGIVLLTNLIGATAFAFAAARTSTFDPHIRDAFLAIGQEALSHPFTTILLRGIYAGWLIALMVWLLPMAEAARIWIIILLTWLVGLGQFSHIIAGSVEAMYAVAAGAAQWHYCVTHFLIPALIGNIIGGVALVAALNHAQVAAGRR